MGSSLAWTAGEASQFFWLWMVRWFNIGTPVCPVIILAWLQMNESVLIQSKTKCFILRMLYLYNMVHFSRTLTSVHENILEDLCFPSEIVGKRIRIKLDGSRLIKVHLEKTQQTNIEHKVSWGLLNHKICYFKLPHFISFNSFSNQCFSHSPGLEVINLYFSPQLSMKIILLPKIPTVKTFFLFRRAWQECCPGGRFLTVQY